MSCPTFGACCHDACPGSDCDSESEDCDGCVSCGSDCSDDETDTEVVHLSPVVDIPERDDEITRWVGSLLMLAPPPRW